MARACLETSIAKAGRSTPPVPIVCSGPLSLTASSPAELEMDGSVAGDDGSNSSLSSEESVTGDHTRRRVGEILLLCRSSARHTVRPAGRFPLTGGGAGARKTDWRRLRSLYDSRGPPSFDRGHQPSLSSIAKPALAVARPAPLLSATNREDQIANDDGCGCRTRRQRWKTGRKE